MAQIPEHVKKAMTEFAGRLTELEKAVAEFTKVTLEHREKMPPLERARRDIFAASVVNSLYCMHVSTLGNNPYNEELVGIEERRIGEALSRLESFQHVRPRRVVNKKAVKSFVRNALFNVESDRGGNSAWGEGESIEPVVDMSDESQWQEDEGDEVENEDYELEEGQMTSYTDEEDIQDNF